MINTFIKALDFNSSLILFIALAIIVICVLVLAVLYGIRNKRLLLLEEHIEGLDKLLKAFDVDKTLEDNLSDLLEAISSIIEVQSYAMYFLDEKNMCYVLKTVRQSVSTYDKISPSYSGLLPYKRESFFMPPSLPLETMVDRVEIKSVGEVPLLFMPMKDSKALIIMGPAKYIKKEKLKLLDILSIRLQAMLNSMVEIEELRREVKLVVTSGNAVRNISNLFNDSQGMLSMMMGISLKAINAAGGMFITSENNKFNLQTSIGLEEEIKKFVNDDFNTLKLFFELLGNEKFVNISKKDKEFFRVPPYFIAEGAEVFLLLKVLIDNEKAMAVFWFNKNPNIKDYQVTALQIMVKRMGDVINNHLKFKELSLSYVDILKTLAKLVDNLKPSTVGYSELMYRYAVIISKELKLSPSEVKDIGLAAYLSNIGVIGLSDDILFKMGKYTDIEYEMMKLHAEVGASIIEATTGNEKVAKYIRHHHERVDGHGYPLGLRGEEIPLGSRIIAVIQTFLAKIIAREYRTALPFEQAIEQLKSAADTQLDSEVVRALVTWFERKQKENISSNKSLGYCWEMRCTPENICINCPAYKNHYDNCWNVKENNCAAHGNNCDSCFVKTEFLTRMKKR